MKTLCNNKQLRIDNTVFYNFTFYKKQKDPKGDICYYWATLCHRGAYTQENASVAVQNEKIISWQT